MKKTRGEGRLIELKCNSVMQGSIRRVTIPRATTALLARGGELFEAVLSRTLGSRGWGKSKITSLCFRKVHHRSRRVGKMAEDSVAVERSL